MFLLPSAIAYAAKIEGESLIGKFNHLAEGWLLEAAVLFKIFTEAIAILILVLANF